MMHHDRFEQDLPALLADLAPRTRPDFRDDIVRQTATMRQRPAWVFPGRWVPVSAITTRAIPAPPVSRQVVGIIALLVLALAVSLALVAGSRPHVPAPFGRAGNGVVVLEKGGDIYTADPVTGSEATIVADTNWDVRPVFSAVGTHMVFERETGALGRLMVANADGSGLITVTPDALAGFDTFPLATAQYTFSPDGTEILIWSTAEAGGRLWIAKADGSGVRPLDMPMTVREAAYLPPYGAELIVTASTNGGQNGVFAIDPRTGTQRTILAPSPDSGLDYVRPSPDGTRLAYVSSSPTVTGPSSYRVHVVGVDGRNDDRLQLPPGAVFQDAPAWSNDGARLAITRGYQPNNGEMAVAVIAADGSDPKGVESAHGITGCCDTILQWAPDDTSVLVVPEDQGSGDPTAAQHLLVDPLTGSVSWAPWAGNDPPAWQRIAP